MAQPNDQIDNLTSAFEQLEDEMRKSFVHSTPKPSLMTSRKSVLRKSDPGVETAIQTPDRDETGDTIVLGARPKVKFSHVDTSREFDGACETLPLGNNECISTGFTNDTNSLHNDSRKGKMRSRSESRANDQYQVKTVRDDKSPSRNSNQGVKIKPATFDGISSWIDYKSHFEMVAKVNDWSEDQKGLYLAVSLRGQVQAILSDLPLECRSDYTGLLNALEERFAPSSQTELYRVRFRERRMKANETLSELGQILRRLSNLAYPTAPRDVRETLAKEQFIDALHESDMRLKIKQSRPKNLDEAIRLAVELEAFNKAEKSNKSAHGYLRSADSSVVESSNITAIEKMEQSVESLQKIMKDLLCEMNELKSERNSKSSYVSSRRSVRKCFNFWRECELPKKPNLFGKGRGRGNKNDTGSSSRGFQSKTNKGIQMCQSLMKQECT